MANNYSILSVYNSLTIDELLTLWGEWSRRGVYTRYKAFSLENKETKIKDINEDDIDIINSAINMLDISRIKDMVRERNVLMLYYYGDEIILDGAVIIKKLNQKQIAKKLKVSEKLVGKLLDNAVSFVSGVIATKTMLVPNLKNI